MKGSLGSILACLCYWWSLTSPERLSLDVPSMYEKGRKKEQIVHGCEV